MKKNYIHVSFFLLCFCLFHYAAGPTGATAAESRASDAPGYSFDALRFMADRLTRTGLGRDGIAPLNKPRYVRVADAGLSMDDREPVFVMHYPGGLVRVYPQYLMVWHEVINDTLPRGPGENSGTIYSGGNMAEDPSNNYTITYSPLTGTVTAFRSMAGRYPSTFGNEGALYNGNTILYDRFSGGLWSQLLAVCIEGPLRGKRLERVPVYWARWGGVKNRFPEAEVLSRSTGHKRNYGRDPYGSYLRSGSYYDDANIFYPVTAQNTKLPAKERILGLEIAELYGALAVDSVRQNKILNLSLGLNRLVAIYDEELDRVRVFNRKMSDGTIYEFREFEKNFVDTNTMSRWNSDGECFYGRMRGYRLEPVLAIDSMWYAWFAFHQDTQILGVEEKKQEIRRGPNIPY